MDLNSWILKKLASKNLKLIQFDWPEKLGINVYDFGAKYCVGPKIYTGRGTSIDREDALHKAVAESIERYIVEKIQRLTSSGIALHKTLKLAKNTAVNEILERDQFLSYFYSNTPFKRSEPSFSPIIKTIQKTTSVFSWQTDFFLLNNRSGIFTTMSVIRNDGIYVGLSAQNNLLKSYEHACIEAFRNWVHDIYFENRVDRGKITLEILSNNSCPENHGDFYLEKYNFKRIEHLFNGSTNSIFENFYPNVQTDIVDLGKIPTLEELDLLCINAFSTHCQSLFFGVPSEFNLNLHRIKDFSGVENFSMANVLSLPHPLR